MPAATGRLASPSAAITVTTSFTVSITKNDAMNNGPAARNQRSCWRSTEPLVRYRTITDTTASSSASIIPSQAQSPYVKSGKSISTGFSAPVTVSRVPGPAAMAADMTRNEAAASQATARHRDESRRPVGNRRRRNVPRPSAPSGARSATKPAQEPPGSVPGDFRSA